MAGLRAPVHEVRLERREQPHGACAGGLGRLQLPERDRPLDQQGALAEVVPAQADRLAGAQAGVRQYRHERRVERAVALKQIGAHPLDRRRRQRPHDPGPGLAGLADITHRVAVDPPPLDGSLENRLQHGQRFADGGVTDAVGGHRGTQVADDLDGELGQAVITDPWDQMHVQRRRITLPCVSGQVGRYVTAPPQLRELLQCFGAGVDRRGAAESLSAPELLVERVGIALSADDTGVRLPLFIAPADPVHAAVLALEPFDAHRSGGTVSVEAGHLAE
ncbi:MAG: hypothetical protein WAL22_09410 [Solirubrobacteraceae bacterium]